MGVPPFPNLKTIFVSNKYNLRKSSVIGTQLESTTTCIVTTTDIKMIKFIEYCSQFGSGLV